MGHLSSRRGLRAGTLTSLVGVDAALHAPHDGRAQQPGERLLRTERGFKDHAEDFRNLAEVHAEDDDGEQDVGARHKRHNQGGKVGNALHAADDDDGQHARQDDGGPPHANAPRVFHGRSHTVGLDTGEEVTRGQNHGDGEDDAVDEHEGAGLGVLIGLLDVVGRATAVLAGVLVLLLVHLRQGTFHKRRGRPQKRHRPHPEHRAWAAERDGGGHTRNVAHAHAAGQGNHQGLEGGHASVRAFTVLDLLDHVRDAADLQELGHEGEVDADGQTEEDQRW